MSYDESHIGNKIKNKKAICPNCGKHGIDKDGYCVYCGEYIGIHDDTKTTIALILGVVNLILSSIILLFLFRNAGKPTEVAIVSSENIENSETTSEEFVPEEGTVDKVIYDINQNSIAAREKYMSQVITVKGKILRFGSDGHGFAIGPMNSQENERKYISCSPDDGEPLESIINYSVGDEITVTGYVTYFSEGIFHISVSQID